MTSALRLVEWLATLSLCADLANGRSFEQGLRTALLATELGRRRGERPETLRATLLISLVRDLGCTAFAPEEAELCGGDDVLFRATMRPLDNTGPRGFVAGMRAAREAGLAPASLVWETLRRGGPAEVRHALASAACEAGSQLATDLGLDAGVAHALTTVWERWDGSGSPAGLSGAQIPFAIRAVHVAERFVHASERGIDHARAQLNERAGRELDPELASEAIRDADDLGLVCTVSSVWDALRAAEPAPTSWVEPDEIPRLARATADFVDLKSRYRARHGRQVATLALEAARVAGWDDAVCARVELAALLHDVGMVAVPSGILDKPGPLTRSERERVAMHEYQGQRLLAQVPSLSGLAPLVGAVHMSPGAADGRGADENLARLLAAADVYAALRSTRAWRAAFDEDRARALLLAEAERGTLGADAARWVLDGEVGRPSRRSARSSAHGLTDRELDCAARLTRGLSNKAIASELGISPRTVQHHVLRVYAKLGVKSRAGATLALVREGVVS